LAPIVYCLIDQLQIKDYPSEQTAMKYKGYIMTTCHVWGNRTDQTVRSRLNPYCIKTPNVTICNIRDKM